MQMFMFFDPIRRRASLRDAVEPLSNPAAAKNLVSSPFVLRYLRCSVCESVPSVVTDSSVSVSSGARAS